MKPPSRRTLNAIPAHSVREFLLQQKFKPMERWGEYLQVFAAPTDPSRTVVVPIDDRIRDYDNRLAMLLNDLSELYGQSLHNIVVEIANSGYEPLRIVANEGENENTLPYDAAIDLLRNAYRLVDASAVVELADHPVRIVQGRRKDVVRDYLDNVRVGQTEVGSYVLTLLLPRRAPSLSGEWADAETDPFGAKVAKRLNQSLATARAAVSNEDTDAESLAERGLTANFATSLARMVNVVPKIGVGVQSGTGFDPALQELHRFRASDRVSLLQVGNKLSPPEKRSPISIRGTITQITEPKKKTSGHIVLETEIYGMVRPVRIPYRREQREAVLQAIEHKTEVTLEIEGTLLERRGQYHLEDPQDFRVVRRRLLT